MALGSFSGYPQVDGRSHVMDGFHLARLGLGHIVQAGYLWTSAAGWFGYVSF